MKRVLGIVLAVMVLLLLPAFRRHSPISRRLVAGGVGMDRMDDQILLSVQPLGDETSVSTLIGHTVGAAVAASPDALGQGLELRQNRLFCIGEETAKTADLLQLCDYWIRSGNGRLTADVAVCRGESSELLKTTAVDRVIDLAELSATMGQGVRCRLLDLQRNLTDTGDAVIPMVQIEGESAVLGGAMLFHRHRFVTELTASQASGVSIVRGDAESSTVVCRPDDCAATVELTDIRCDIQAQQTDDRWQFAVAMTSRATVTESSGKPSDERLTQAVQEQLSAQLLDTVSVTAQAYGCDVLGLTDTAKKQMPFAASAVNGEWEQHLKSAEYRVSVSVNITEVGLRD